MPPADRPLLVIVGGAPATGKTTLAGELARRLRAAIVTKDDVKETIADALGSGDRARSRELGAAAYGVLFRLARRALESGASVVVEANFYRDGSAHALRALAELGDAVVVLCHADEPVRRARYTARRDRHPVHLDAEILANEWPHDDTLFDLDLGVPKLVVDANDGYRPDLDAITRWVAGRGSDAS